MLALWAVAFLGWCAGTPAPDPEAWNLTGAVLAEPLPTTSPTLTPTPKPSPTGSIGYQPSVNIWKVYLKNTGAYTIKVCIESDTTRAAGDKDGECQGGLLPKYDHYYAVPFHPGDHLIMYLHILDGPIKRDVDVTGANKCEVTGTVQAAKLTCDSFKATTAPPVSPPSIAPYDPESAKSSNGKSAQMNLLNVVAWCVTAAGVTGLIVVGMQMALQIRRGVPGALAEIRQEIIIVAASCILAMTVGPVVSYIAIPLW